MRLPVYDRYYPWPEFWADMEAGFLMDSQILHAPDQPQLWRTGTLGSLATTHRQIQEAVLDHYFSNWNGYVEYGVHDGRPATFLQKLLQATHCAYLDAEPGVDEPDMSLDRIVSLYHSAST